MPRATHTAEYTASKEYVCDACGLPIHEGDRYKRIFCLHDEGEVAEVGRVHTEKGNRRTRRPGLDTRGWGTARG